ncbi:MAG: hypothetical protein ACC631_11600 [Halocynthiibacter sp.]
MTLFAVSLILFAALLHAIWNAIVKQAGDRMLSLGLVALGQVIPGVILAVLLPFPGWVALPYILLSTVIHWGYFVMLGKAYAHGDLSVVYPIARGIVPVLVSLWAWILLDEALPLAAWGGIALVTAGIQVASWGAFRGGIARTALYFALGTGVFISAYSVVDGIGVRLSVNTLSYVAWGGFLHAFIVVFVAAKRAPLLRHVAPRDVIVGLAGGVVSLLAYGLVLYAKTLTVLGAVSALRETSVVFAALIGVLVLGEGNWRRRLLSALIVAAGVVVIALSI